MSDAPSGPGWRADVRERIAVILADRVPLVSGRVLRAQVWPVQGGKKPALLVYGYAERKEPVTKAGGFQHQFSVTCGFAIRVLCEGASAAAEVQCEQIVGQVERAILQAPELWSPENGVLERCAGVNTQLSAEQKDRPAEVEATIEFQLAWSETFEMAAPDTSECETTTFVISDPAIPAP